MKIRYPLIILFLIIALFLNSCVATKLPKQQERPWQLFVEGTIQSVKGNEIVVALKLPQLKKMPDSPLHEIARQLVQKTLLLPGTKTEIEGGPATIKEVWNNLLTVALDTQKTYPLGANLKIKIPMKTIAIMDFEVIRGQEKEAGRATLEELTSVLIETGYFIVVERSKLKTILSEHELSQTGLAKEPAEKIVGKLLTADLILTGTLSEMGNIWDLNLRLVDVRTGQALAAIAMKTLLPTGLAIRNAELNEDFSKRPSASWILGHLKSKGGMNSISWDRNTGADGSKGSLRIDFDYSDGLGMGEGYAGIINGEKRDLSLFSGIEFYVKATRPLSGVLGVKTSLPDDPRKCDYWNGYFEITTDWQKIAIPFKQLRISSYWAKHLAEKSGYKLGDQILRPNRIEDIQIFILAGQNKTVNGKVAGTIWVEKIHSYR